MGHDAVLSDLIAALTVVRDRFFPADQAERDRDLDWDVVNGALARAAKNPPATDAESSG